LNEGTGICFSFVQIAHSLGSKIIIGDLKLTPEAEEFVSKAGSSRIVFHPCDVSKWDQLQMLVSVSEDKYDDVPDIWIAGAGIFEPVSLEVHSNTLCRCALNQLSPLA
jgi:hypothetical protein